MKNKQQNNIDIIKESVREDLEIIEKLLNDVVTGHTNLITEIGNNIFSAGGKRIRPILTILGGRLFDYNQQELYYLATAVELIHSATLLHDDVIDNGKLRRGKETSNVTHGNKSSILVGDFLFAESFKLMVRSNSLESLKILSEASSVISEGEIKQLEFKQQKTFLKDVYFGVIKAKTAILFGAATEASACLAKRSSGECKLLREFGINLGLAFQIIDDILDYNAEQIIFGKKIGTDFFEQKITLPIIELYNRSSDAEKSEIQELFNSDILEENHLNHIISLLQKKNIFDICHSQAQGYVDNALEILKHFSNSEAKDILKVICNTAVSRKF